MTVSAEQGSIADVGSPVLIAPDAVDARGALGWVSEVIVVATALLLLLNAHAMQGWFDELTPGPTIEPLRKPIAAWQGATARAGLDTPRARLHGWWDRTRALRFGHEQPGQQGEGEGQ